MVTNESLKIVWVKILIKSSYFKFVTINELIVIYQCKSEVRLGLKYIKFVLFTQLYFLLVYFMSCFMRPYKYKF